MANTLRKPISLLLAMLIILSIFTIVPVTTASAATVTDMLDQSFTGATNNYISWQDKPGPSGAVYAGNSAGGNSSIQLRSTNNNSGIVTTASGGYAAKVKVIWNNNTISGRTLDIYGKNTPYTGAGDLYDASARGEKLGSIIYGTGTELDIIGSYQYIGMRSNSGAQYLNQIDIVWESEAPPAPSGYTVTWKNKNGSTTLETDTNVASGATPEYNGSTPRWTNTAQYTYTFDGWTDQVDGTTVYNAGNPFPPVTGNVTYYAHHSAVLNTYTVTWLDDDGSDLGSETVPYGTVPAYSGTPSKAPDGETVYTFDGWISSVSGAKTAAGSPLPAVTGDVTYTASYKARTGNTDVIDLLLTGVTGNVYMAWSDKTDYTGAVYAGKVMKNGNGMQLNHTTSNNNYPGIITTATAGRAKKVVVEWHDNSSNVNRVLNIYGKNTAYTATTDLYQAATQGELLGTITCEDLSVPGVLNIAGNVDYIAIVPASNAMILDAVYITWLPGHAYDVTWKNEDGTVLEKDESVDAGSTPSYDGATPQKAADAEYSYAFMGWTDGTNRYSLTDPLPALTSDITYTALYSETVNTYTITWYDEDGTTELGTSTAEYGTVPVYTGTHPTKSSDGANNYYLSGWTPAVTEVTGDASYTAVFSATPITNDNTVIWQNYDFSVLETDNNVVSGSRASYGKAEPTRASDAYYTYSFYGWGVWNEETGKVDIQNRFLHSDPPYITESVTFVALYSATPTAAYRSGRINQTDIDQAYTLNNYYRTIEGAVAPIVGADLVFDESHILRENKLYLGSYAVADMTPPPNGTFSHTVYVTGDGTEEDPYVFHPNYIFSRNVAKVADAADTDKSIIHPGDGFKGMAKIRIGYDYLRYLQYMDQEDLECNHGTNGFMGVSKSRYGNRYANEHADPYPFVEGSVLFYVGELTGAHNFTEILHIDNAFGEVKDMYTVTWNNWDNTTLRTNQIYVGESPRYGTIQDAIPTRTSADTTYTFSGWKNETTGVIYDKDDILPPVTADVTYTAQFTEASHLFVGHSLTLNGDIGVNFYLNVTEDQINSEGGVIVRFTWDSIATVSPVDYRLDTTKYYVYEGKKYYLATCWVAAAEMTCNIHAVAIINGTVQSETDDYDVRQYGMYILSQPDGTYEKQTELFDLVRKMLDYGAKAQLQFGVKTGDLANKEITADYTMQQITDIDSAIPWQKDDMRANTESVGLTYAGSTLIYLSKTTLRHYYTIKNRDLFNSVKDTATFVYGEKSPYIYFEKSDIKAPDLNQPQEFSIGGLTYRFSALDYCRIRLENSSVSQTEKDLITATYWYNKAAVAYF